MTGKRGSGWTWTRVVAAAAADGTAALVAAATPPVAATPVVVTTSVVAVTSVVAAPSTPVRLLEVANAVGKMEAAQAAVLEVEHVNTGTGVAPPDPEVT